MQSCRGTIRTSRIMYMWMKNLKRKKEMTLISMMLFSSIYKMMGKNEAPSISFSQVPFVIQSQFTWSSKKNAYKGETYEAQSSYAHVGVIEKTSRLGRAIGEDMMKKPMRLGDDLERNYDHYHHVAPQ